MGWGKEEGLLNFLVDLFKVNIFSGVALLLHSLLPLLGYIVNSHISILRLILVMIIPAMLLESSSSFSRLRKQKSKHRTKEFGNNVDDQKKNNEKL